MQKLLERLAAVLSLSASLVLPASAVAHGHAHHELAHGHHMSGREMSSGFGAVSAPDKASEHPHLLAGPILLSRFVPPVEIAATPVFEIAGSGTDDFSGVWPASCHARAPPLRQAPTDSRPRSPPAV